MNTCEYPEIKFISFLIFSQYQMRIKNFVFIQEVTGNTHIFFLGLTFNIYLITT